MAGQRAYPSGLTDEQWEIIEPMLPLIKEPGRIPKHPFRDVVDAILYLDRSGSSWRQLPVGCHRLAVGQGSRHRRQGHARLRRGQEINGRKRFIVTDTLGLPAGVTVLAASWQARAARRLLVLADPAAFADRGFAGRLIEWAARTLRMVIDIARQPADERGFQVHPKAVGCRTNPCLTHRPPQTGPRLRTRPGDLRGDDPLRRITRGKPDFVLCRGFDRA
jgi:hypothetical protein